MRNNIACNSEATERPDFNWLLKINFDEDLIQHLLASLPMYAKPYTFLKINTPQVSKTPPELSPEEKFKLEYPLTELQKSLCCGQIDLSGSVAYELSALL